MQIIGTDSQGNAIAIEHGLTRSTLYRGTPKGKANLHGTYDVGGDVLNALQSGSGGFNWSQLLTGLSPIIVGVGQRIAGNHAVVPINPSQPVTASGPGFFGSINPMYLMLGGGALLLVMMMRR
jgi:hypothetical protein